MLPSSSSFALISFITELAATRVLPVESSMTWEHASKLKYKCQNVGWSLQLRRPSHELPPVTKGFGRPVPHAPADCPIAAARMDLDTWLQQQDFAAKRAAAGLGTAWQRHACSQAASTP